MLRNYFRVAYRNLLRYRALSGINIFGLSVGLACCILIFLFDQYELSYDRFYPNAERIYRVSLRAMISSSELNSATSPTPMSAALQREIPEVQSAVRIQNTGFPVIRYKDKAFSEERFYWGDSNFFDLFSLPFLKGDPHKALTQPNTVVITESMANKYFGNEDPIGKILNLDKRNDFLVTGVIKDVPANTHFSFDFMGALSLRKESQDPSWLNNNHFTYVLLRPKVTLEEFQDKLSSVVNKYVGPQVQQALGVSFEQMKAAGNRYGYIAEPLKSIHLHSNLEHELEANGDITYVYIFSAIAAGILLIASINFMNLATARSERRAKEVGIRKTLGSSRTLLIGQFLTESVVMSSIAVIFALILVELALPFFNNLSGKQIHLDLLNSSSSIPLLIVFSIGVGILAGSYPAFFLSSFKPVTVLKGSMASGGRKSLLRGGLVIFQFAISIVLSIGTFIVYTQLNFIQNKKLGLNQEQIITMSKVDDIAVHIASFKQALLQNVNIISASNSTTIPGSNFGDSGFKVEGAAGNEIRDIKVISCDNDFLKTYQMELAKGRFFSLDFPSDSNALVINETAADYLGLKEPIGVNLLGFGQFINGVAPKFPIIGVVKDFNYESLHVPVRPLIFRPFGRGGFGRFMSIKVGAGQYQETLSFLEKTWRQYADNQAFEYNFLDQHLSRLYLAERRIGKVITVFSMLAIIIACLGLLGLAAFVTEQRTKEIGIRKVLGASISEIVYLLSKEFTKWVLIANVIAWPVAYYTMTQWLMDFAYRIDISLWSFFMAGLVALLIAILTVSYQAMKAATANPVEALKYE